LKASTDDAKDYEDFIENIELVVDGEVLAKAEMNGKYLTFNLNEGFEIEKKHNETFTIRADIIG
jgi:hypothetical protein